MTDNEIIKALECCTGDFDGCASCPLYDHCCDRGYKLIYYALDLINRQKAEIERLNGCVKSEDEVRTIAETVIQSRIKTIRTETVKDFMKMLTKVWGHYPLNFMTSVDAFYSTVKQIAREMVGEDK